MKLSVFTGGLNTRQSPLLIAPNEAVQIENVKIDNGIIVPSRGSEITTISAEHTPYFFDYLNEWFDEEGAKEYMEYQRGLYWTVEEGKAQKFTPGKVLQTLAQLPDALGLSQSIVIDDYVYLFGGWDGINVTDKIYRAPILDPLAWEDTGSTLPTILSGSQVLLIGDYVYLFGGFITATTDKIYRATKADPTTWIDTGETLPTPLRHSQIVLVPSPYGSGEAMYLFGGWDGSEIVNIIYIAHDFDPLSWSDGGINKLPVNLRHSQVAVVNDTIYLFGGQTDLGTTDDIYSAPLSDPFSWQEAYGNLPTPLQNSNLAQINNKLYLLGGYYEGATDVVYVAQAQTPLTWTISDIKLPDDLTYAQLEIIGELVYLFGGADKVTYHNKIYTAIFGISNNLGIEAPIEAPTLEITEITPPADVLAISTPHSLSVTQQRSLIPGAVVPAGSTWTFLTILETVTLQAPQWAYLASDVMAWKYENISYTPALPCYLYLPYTAGPATEQFTDPDLNAIVFFQGYMSLIPITGAGVAGTYTFTAVVEKSKCMLQHVTHTVTITTEQQINIYTETNYTPTEYDPLIPPQLLASYFKAEIVKVYCSVDVTAFVNVPIGVELIIGTPPTFTYNPYDSQNVQPTAPNPAYIYDAIAPAVTTTLGVGTVRGGIVSSLVDVDITKVANEYLSIGIVAEAGEQLNVYKKVAGVYYLIKAYANRVFNYLEVFDHTSALVWEAKNITGVLQYLYTYYNILDGTESAPSPLTAEVDVTSAIIAITCPSSDDPQVTHAKIYRVGGILLGLTEVGELEYTDFNETYTDGTPAIDVSGALLSSQLNTAPPEGLRYIQHVYGLFIGALDDKFYFTLDIGNPNYWPSTYYINFDSDITGLAVVGSGILIFTKYKTYIIIGTNAQTFVKYTLSEDQGCINSDTIVERGSQVLFMSSDGLCSSSGTDVTVISRPKLGKLDYTATGKAVIHDDVYYLLVQPIGILAFDFRYTPAFMWFDSGLDRFFHYDYLVVGEDKLYGSYNNVLEELFQDDKLEYTYKTGLLTEGSASMLKSYKSVYVASSWIPPVDQADATVISIYIDGEQVISKALYPGSSHEIKIPQAKQQGYNIQYELKGKSDVYEIEYKAMARQNGR